MVAGTFNLIMAQRLTKRVCPHCAHTISIKGTPQRHDAIESFHGIEPNVLKEEIMKRQITADVWQ
ncbi:hypothetical protein KAZ93_01340 [Patescibacteria group bacterium]|nr:hypothetical protein [Patescibacteria group bacterium]